MSDMKELESVAYSLLYAYLHDWYRENISEDDGDWELKADKLAHRLAAEFECDITRYAEAFESFYASIFSNELKQKRLL